MTVTTNRTLGALILISCCLTAWASTAEAQLPRPLDRTGRLLGVGWGDGYHACESSGIRPLADLPPRSSLNRPKATRSLKQQFPIRQIGSTFYDRFDAARSSCQSCDGNQRGCDSCASSHSGPMTIINGSEVVQLRQQVADSKKASNVASEVHQPAPTVSSQSPVATSRPEPTPTTRPSTVPSLKKPQPTAIADQLPKKSQQALPSPIVSTPVAGKDTPGFLPPSIREVGNSRGNWLTKPSDISEPSLKTASIEKKRPIRPTIRKNITSRTIAVPVGAKKLKFGFDGLPTPKPAANLTSPVKPIQSTATPKAISIRHPGNLRPATDNDSVIDATLTNTPELSIPMPRAVIGGFKVHSSSSKSRSAPPSNQGATTKPRPVRLFDPSSVNRTQTDSIELVDFNASSNAGVIVQPATRK